MKKILVLLILLSINFSAHAEEVSEDALQKLIVGNTFDIHFEKKSKQFTAHLYLTPDGQIRAKNNNNDVNEGTWSNEGGVFCVEWTLDLQWTSSCGPLEPQGSDYVWKNGLKKSPRIEALSGNPHNL